MSSLRAQDPPQQRISGDERDFVTTAEPLRQPFSAVFGPAEPFWRGELLRRDRPSCHSTDVQVTTQARDPNHTNTASYTPS